MKAGIKTFLLKTSLLLLCVATVHADSFSVIHNFGITNKMTGFHPESPLVQGPDGALYGVSGGGGVVRAYNSSAIIRANENINGLIFRINPDGTGFQSLYIFTNSADGTGPVGGMVLAGDTLYGTCVNGGAYGDGVVFSIKTNGTSFTHVYDFGAVTNDGVNPFGTLAFSGGTLYGTTTSGGLSNQGTVFSVNAAGGTPSYLVNFAAGKGGYNPYAGLVLSGNSLYGSTVAGGSGYNMPYSVGSGVIFKVNTDGNGYSILQNMGGALGSYIQTPFFLSGNVLYGAAANGGANGSGTIFSLNTDGSNFTNIYNFSFTDTRDSDDQLVNSDGVGPGAVIMVSNVLYGITTSGGSNGLGSFFSVHSDGSAFSILHYFGFTSGYFNSQPGLLSSSNQFYGVTPFGGANGFGCLYSINSDGSGYTNLLNFGGCDGLAPSGQLLVTNGQLYGTTVYGGGGGYGMVFQLGTDGTGYTNLYSFEESDNYFPVGGLAMVGNRFYGSVSASADGGAGGVFGMNADGSGFTNLQSFLPYFGPIPLVAANGVLFGVGYEDFPELYSIGTNGQNFRTTSMGGDTSYPSLTSSGNILYGSRSGEDSGGIFVVDTNGPNFNFIFRFYPPYPVGGQCELLVVNDTIYGVSTYGGTFGQGAVFSVGTNGSSFTMLHNFTPGNGRFPGTPLTLVNGTLYGTTGRGGASDTSGTIYSVNTDGTGFMFRHSFTGGSDGRSPSALVLSGNTLYGVAGGGGSMGMGTVFALTAQPVLSSQISGDNVVLSWIDPNYTLQSAPNPTGVYTTISGAASPYTNSLSGPQQYYRLIPN